MTKISLDKQYRTRDGREVRIYAVDGGAPYCVHGAWGDGAGWYQNCWTPEGRASVSGFGGPIDLIEVRPRIKRTVWLNVYPGDVTCWGYASRRLADENSRPNRIACVKVEIDCEHGEGLE